VDLLIYSFSRYFKNVYKIEPVISDSVSLSEILFGYKPLG